MSKGAGHRPPLSLVIPAGVVVALLQLPLVYLAVRALGGGDAWEVLWRVRTLELVISTGLLVLGVTTASVSSALHSPGSLHAPTCPAAARGASPPPCRS